MGEDFSNQTFGPYKLIKQFGSGNKATDPKSPADATRFPFFLQLSVVRNHVPSVIHEVIAPPLVEEYWCCCEQCEISCFDPT